MSCSRKLETGETLRLWFLRSAVVVLAATGSGKVFGALGPARALDLSDPLIGIPFRQLLLLVGLVELFIAFFSLFAHKRWLSVLSVAWISTNFLVYRAGLWLVGWHRPCGCMGSLTDMLHIPPRMADNIMKAALAYLLVGSYAILLSEWRRGRVAKSVPPACVAPV